MAAGGVRARAAPPLPPRAMGRSGGGMGGGALDVRVQVTTQMDGEGKLKTFVRAEAAEVAQAAAQNAVEGYDRHVMPGRAREALEDQWRVT